MQYLKDVDFMSISLPSKSRLTKTYCGATEPSRLTENGKRPKFGTPVGKRRGVPKIYVAGDDVTL